MAKKAPSAVAAIVSVPPISVPELTLEQARILVFWHEATLDRDTGEYNASQAPNEIHARWGFAAWDDIGKLRDEFTPALLGRWGLPHPMSDMLCLHPYLRENPGKIYEALNSTERSLGMRLTSNPYAEDAHEDGAAKVVAKDVDEDSDTPAESKPAKATKPNAIAARKRGGRRGHEV